MGIYERDYMKAPQPRPGRMRPTLGQRIRFYLWLLGERLRGGRKRGSSGK